MILTLLSKLFLVFYVGEYMYVVLLLIYGKASLKQLDTQRVKNAAFRKLFMLNCLSTCCACIFVLMNVICGDMSATAYAEK